MLKPKFQKKDRVYYVHIPAIKDVVTGKAKPEKARPASDVVQEHYWPHQGTGLQIVYKLFSRGKMINEKELYSDKDKCQDACDIINQELASITEIKPKKQQALNTIQHT